MREGSDPCHLCFSSQRGARGQLAAVLSVLFLSVYAAAHHIGWEGAIRDDGMVGVIGILIGFVLVVAYCYAGGIRVWIWTDAAQSCVMIVGSVLLCWVALGEVGGFDGLHAGLDSNANLTHIFPSDLMLGVTPCSLRSFWGGWEWLAATSSIESDDAWNRGGQETGHDLVLRLADSIHPIDAHHRTG